MEKIKQDDWEIIDLARVEGIKGKIWDVRCRYCGNDAQRSTIQLNRGYPKCPCQPSHKTTILLEYAGNSLSISGWASLYPDDVKPNTVRTYYYYREIGKKPYVNYTDAQILFGKNGAPKGVIKNDRIIKDVKKKLKAPFSVKNLGQKLATVAENIVMDWIDENQTLKDMMFEEINPVKDGEAVVVGRNYTLQIGLTIGDLLLSGTSIEEITSFLEMEAFSTLDEKVASFNNILPKEVVQDYIDESSGLQKLSYLERLALLSLGVT